MSVQDPDYRRVEKAIRYLEANRADQPGLEELAEHVGVSPSHLHRTFQRWAGVTPKRFLQALTVEHARRALERSRSVLDAAYDAGLSGGGRLHDHFVSVEAVTPGEAKEGGRGLEIRTGVHASPYGPAFVAATDRGICFLAFLESGADDDEAAGELRSLWPEARIVEDPSATASLARRAFAPLRDEELDAPLPLHLKGTNFQVQVWRALLRIPEGEVVSYGRLAEAVGRPGAARAVGSAVGANPVSWLIPCHRVIRSVGELGDYRWGPTRKRAMLGREMAGVSPRPRPGEAP